MTEEQENEQKRVNRSFKRKIKRYTIIIGILLFIGIVSYIAILYGGRLVVNEEELILDATTTIETVEGDVIYRLYNENRHPITLNEVPEHVKNAFIAIEDIRFYSHKGVDFKSIIRAIYRDIIARSKVEGASTITQQLAKNLFLENDKTWMRKTKEVMAALYMERNYTKDEILELYLNRIYFGQGLYGIEVAAQKFFSKSVSELSLSEGAMLAGIIKGPNGYSPINHAEKALNRRDLVLRSMNNAGFISMDKMLQEQGKTLGLQLSEDKVDQALDSYIDLVIKEASDKHQLTVEELKRGGYRIIVTINEDFQKIAHTQFKEAEYFPGNTAGVEGAFVMMDQETGSILAAVGGRDYTLGDLNRVVVERQPGSTMKPLAVYAPALMKGSYGPYSLIKDEQIEYEGELISNIDDQYAGEVSIYEALKQSKNAPAAWLLEQIGIDYAKGYLEKMNINIVDKGISIALGGLRDGLTPINMVESYRAFANNGEVVDPFTIEEIYNQQGKLIAKHTIELEEVLSPQVAWNMTEMLITVVEEGTGSVGEYNKVLAGKTGSTEHPHAKGNYKDAWFVGYTPEYVSALWMGYDISDENHYLTGGSSYPTKLTKKILTEIDKQHSLVANFIKPEGVTSLPEPINLPEITNVNVAYTFGGFSIVKGKLTWAGPVGERVHYHIYKLEDGQGVKIDEVVDENEYIIDSVPIFSSSFYYIVPYDSLTETEGEPSEIVELSL